ncbi:MAG TPA: NAD(P)-dependent oxidoreductase [Sedimenticola thiotaurini]|uniref:NAD(P)-dependent oxidoreductase n=1 Tax=Sedimenticola thiotaurini TaxID=1543721 RepID=A0A831W411_9GAMM|nr:NAD(P)-dependent oxidoreductase [Sedimenticola thiotaurini]
MLKLVYVGGLGMMAGPAAIHLTPAETARVLRVHDRGSPGEQKVSFRLAWKEHGAELVPDFDRLIGDGDLDGVVVCAGKNGDDLPIIAELTRLLRARCRRPVFILHLSTVSPPFVEAAVRFCRQAGIDYANYPLTGGPLGAMLGGGDPRGMLILASGERPLYERLLPTLKRLGHPRFFGGEPAAGAVTKLIGQHLVFNGLAGISSATALHGVHFNQHRLGGPEQADYLGFLNGGAGGTRQWEVAMKKGVEEQDWAQGFSIRHAVVDAIYAARLAIDSGLPRFNVQPMIDAAFAFSWLLESYPGQNLATHAIVREMVGPGAAGLDRFMAQHGAWGATVEESLDACIGSLPGPVQGTVWISPTVEEFERAAAG